MLQRLADELTGVGACVAEQVRAGLPLEDVLESHLQAFTTMIQQLQSLTSLDASMLTSKINAGPWSGAQKTQLARAVLQQLMKPTPALATRRKFQTCRTFEQYLLADEWTGLNGRAIRAAKITQLCSRAWSIGIICPAETTTWHMAAIIVRAESITDAWDKSDVHEEIKHTIKKLAERHKFPFDYITDYPAEPSGLPEAVRRFAYRGAEPVRVNIFGLSTAMTGAKMRGMKARPPRITLPTPTTSCTAPPPSTFTSVIAAAAGHAGDVDTPESTGGTLEPSPVWGFKPHLALHDTMLAHQPAASYGASKKRKLVGKQPEPPVHATEAAERVLEDGGVDTHVKDLVAGRALVKANPPQV